jgi:hypothetical protein
MADPDDRSDDLEIFIGRDLGSPEAIAALDAAIEIMAAVIPQEEEFAAQVVGEIMRRTGDDLGAVWNISSQLARFASALLHAMSEQLDIDPHLLADDLFEAMRTTPHSGEL